MATLNFPSSPTNGQTYTADNNDVWTFDGTRWNKRVLQSTDNLIGLVPVTKGGTGKNANTADKLLKGNGTNAIAETLLIEDSAGILSTTGSELTLSNQKVTLKYHAGNTSAQLLGGTSTKLELGAANTAFLTIATDGSVTCSSPNFSLNNNALRIVASGTYTQLRTESGKGPLYLGSEGATRLTIDATGNLLVGGPLKTQGWDIWGGSSAYKNLHSTVYDYAGQSGTLAMTITEGSDIRVVPTGALTINFGGFPPTGKAAWWNVEIDGPGANTVSFPQVTWDGGTAPTIQSGTKKTILVFRTRNGGTTIHGAVAFGNLA